MTAVGPGEVNEMWMRQEIFIVDYPGSREGVTVMKRRVADVDLYVRMLASRGRDGVTVREETGSPLPYTEWRATRSEPLPPQNSAADLLLHAGG